LIVFDLYNKNENINNIINKMSSYDQRDDMLECFCNNTNIKHYYYPINGCIYYYPINRCVYYYPYDTKELGINNNHFLKNGKLGWNTERSLNEMNDRRIKSELSQYIIEEKKQIEKNKKLPIEYQPLLPDDYDWYEYHSKTLIINHKSLIYYVNKYTNEISWKHPITGKTNLPGGFENPSALGF